MKILKEGTVKIDSDGNILVEGFTVSGGSINELQAEGERRVRLAIARLDNNIVSEDQPQNEIKKKFKLTKVGTIAKEVLKAYLGR